MTPTLSILTPTIASRTQQLAKLKQSIAKSLGASGADASAIEHCVLPDDPNAPALSIGEKRNLLLQQARGKYIAFVDDDDTVLPAYVGELLAATDSDPDVITFRQHAIIEGVYAMVEFKLGNPNDLFTGGGTVRRNAWHLCAWRRDIALTSRFPHSNHGEDWAWAAPLCAIPDLREIHRPVVLYHYSHSAATTAAFPAARVMPRSHTVNPTITVVMDTVGRKPERMAGAIRSFLAQDYPLAKLVIFNRHPDPLILRGIPENRRMSIEVVNCEDVFMRPVDQHIWNLKQIHTDCWTILDDDDTIDPNHLSQLVEMWNKSAKRSDSPLQVCNPHYLAHYEDRTVNLRVRGWGVSLFERLTPGEVDWCYSQFPKDTFLGSDGWIAWNSYYDKREIEGVTTYHWDRTGKDHVSLHETNPGQTERDRFAVAANYWRIKLAARAKPLLPVDL